MAKMESNQNGEKKIKRSISTVLLTILLPVMALGMIAIIVFMTSRAQTEIINLTGLDLQSETNENAKELALVYENIEARYDRYCEILESHEFESEEALFAFLENTVYADAEADFLITVGFEDDSYVLSNHQRLDESWKPSERPWYQQAWEKDGYSNTEPYIDSTTGNLGISIVRKFTLASGKKGAICIDAYLATLHDQVNELTPMQSGISCVLDLDHGYVVACQDENLEGKTISDSGDEFLQDLANYGETDSAEMTLIETKSEGDWYVSSSGVAGTSWTIFSAVKKSDILATVNSFKIVAAIVMLVMMVVISIIVSLAVRQNVAIPVTALAKRIEQVAGGDFTVELKPGKGDEIGLIRDELRAYTEKMRETMQEIQTTAKSLQEEAETSKEASATMTVEATEQSSNMRQIQEAMEGITLAVSELAGNATNLAESVSVLMDKGMEANDTMMHLVDKANEGQRDMGAVQDNMSGICGSMDEMNRVVMQVGESTEKINGIIEMIDEISMQTNLLSLNASIEAARAGEAGKGFAVVAGEIAKLAQDSTDSTGKIAEILADITNQINTLSKKSEENVNAISNSTEAVNTAGSTFAEIYNELNQTGDTMKSMIKMMGGVDEIATSVAAISEEQSASTEEINATVENLAVSAQRIADESSGVDESARVVAESAVYIGQKLEQFKIE